MIVICFIDWGSFFMFYSGGGRGSRVLAPKKLSLAFPFRPLNPVALVYIYRHSSATILNTFPKIQFPKS